MVMTAIVRDQAGIHVNYYEMVHHKQGVIYLSFTNPSDSTRILQGDEIEVLGLDEELLLENPLCVLLRHQDGTVEELPCKIA